MDNNELDKIVHQWCDDNDRWIYIEYNRDGKVMGLNFMQGDEYEIFKQAYCKNNEYLFRFYKVMLTNFILDPEVLIEFKSFNIEFINKCMWAFHQCSSTIPTYKN